MITILAWTIYRVGASIVIEGRTEDGLPIRVDHVDHVSRAASDGSGIVAVTADGRRFELR